MSEERYLYEIHPVRPFNTKDGKLIKKACSALLTKEEVKEYLAICPMYRKVSGATNKMFRVTLSNLDELHTPDGKGGKVIESAPVVTPNTTNVNIVDESITGNKVEPTVPEEPPVAEETVESTPVTVNDDIKPEDAVIYDSAPTVEEESTETVVEDVETEEASVEDESTTEESVEDIINEGTVQSSNNNYQGKKKHKHH